MNKLIILLFVKKLFFNEIYLKKYFFYYFILLKFFTKYLWKHHPIFNNFISKYITSHLFNYY